MPDDKPWVYTPWFRRFGSERQREIEETYKLHADVARLQGALGLRPMDLAHTVLKILDLRSHFIDPFADAIAQILADERYVFDLPPADFEGMTLKEFAAYRNLLQKKLRFFEVRDQTLRLIEDFLTTVFGFLASDLPDAGLPSPFTIPLIYALPEPRKTVHGICFYFSQDPYREREMFHPTRDRIYDNIARHSGIDRAAQKVTKPIKEPLDSKLPLDELVTTFLGGTHFEALLMTPVPLKLSHRERFSHMHIVGGTGAGKTTLLENLILHDLNSAEPPSLVVVDSQGDLIRKIAQLQLWSARRNLILVDPRDVHHPPALNVFDVNRDRLASYDQATKEQVIAGVIQTFDYLFSGLLGADLTAKQGVLFKYIARLMLSLPETLGRAATILDMIDLMEDATPYQIAIASLPRIQRNFFERDFSKKTFANTKEEIRYRLHAIIENPTLARLFTAPSTKLDLFTELNEGSVILVDTAKDFLKGSSAHFGQIFISLVLQAILERPAIPARERRPTFIVIDECAEYFDSNIDELLTQVRKYNCGVVLAHQYLDQCKPALKASLAANTASKFAAGVSTSDARQMAPELRTSPDFILDQPRLHFAAHIRNVTPQAVSIPVQVGVLDRAQRLSATEFADFRERNRARVAYDPEEVSTTPEGPERPDEDVSDEI